MRKLAALFALYLAQGLPWGLHSDKIGFSMADAMLKPLLLERGFSAAQIGSWAGTFGMALSLLGTRLDASTSRASAL